MLRKYSKYGYGSSTSDRSVKKSTLSNWLMRFPFAGLPGSE